MNELTKRERNTNTVRDMLLSLHRGMESAATQYLSPKRACSLAIQHLRRTPALADCSPQSMVDAVMRCVELGLEPGAADLVYFLPFKGQVVFVPSYRGLVWMATRSGRALDVTARTVRKGDKFEYDYGLNETLSHKVIGTSIREITHAYAIATLSNGHKKFIVLDHPELMRHKAMSPSKSKDVWVNHEAAMCEKTCVRMLFKTIGGAPELNTAVQLDELAAIGKDQPSPFVEGDLIDEPTKPDPEPTGGKEAPKKLDDFVPPKEDSEPVKNLKNVAKLRASIKKKADQLALPEFTQALKDCNLENLLAIDDITKVDELQSILDVMKSAG